MADTKVNPEIPNVGQAFPCGSFDGVRIDSCTPSADLYARQIEKFKKGVVCEVRSQLNPLFGSVEQVVSCRQRETAQSDGYGKVFFIALISMTALVGLSTFSWASELAASPNSGENMIFGTPSVI